MMYLTQPVSFLGVKWLGRDTDHLYQSARIRMSGAIFLLPIRLHDVDRDIFNFDFTFSS
jgi:hypothetical protein